MGLVSEPRHCKEKKLIDLIFDTETTRFPKWKLPNDHLEQTQLVQLGIMIAKGSEVILEWDHLVYCTQEPDKGAFKVHGISKAMCQEAGLTLRQAVGFFDQRLRDVDRVVCHNVNFDRKVMLCAYAQASLNCSEGQEPLDPTYFLEKPNVCTMLTATNVVQVPHPTRGGWKWPTLQESYAALVYGEGFEDAHNAAADVAACHKVLVALEGINAELRSAP